jgi:hypothetical protein
MHPPLLDIDVIHRYDRVEIGTRVLLPPAGRIGPLGGSSAKRSWVTMRRTLTRTVLASIAGCRELKPTTLLQPML